MAKDWDENWGFMKARPEDTVKREFDTCLCKYYAKGILGETEAKVLTKRLPKAPETEEDKVIMAKFTQNQSTQGMPPSIAILMYHFLITTIPILRSWRAK